MRTSVVPSVLWREGMFLSTQHFQVAAAELAQRIASGDRLRTPCGFGLIHLVPNELDLEQNKFTVVELEVLFGDGTLARMPGNAEVASASFAEHLKDAELDVWIGLPEQRSNVAQLEGATQGQLARYRAEPRTAYDENQVDSKQDVDRRILTPRLFFGSLPPEGFDCVPIARLQRDAKKSGTEVKTRLSPDWVPPILALSASPRLVARLEALATKARERVRDLAGSVPSIALLANAEKAVDVAGYMLLQTMGRTVMSLEQIAHATALDPFTAYIELARICGDLALFSPERRPDKLPVYEHAKCHEAFKAVLGMLETLIDVDVRMPYDSVPFVADPHIEGVFTCDLPAPWIDRRAVFYLGIEIDLKPAELAKLVAANWVKLSTREKIVDVEQAVGVDIGLAYLNEAPRSLPKRDHLHFCAIDVEGPSRVSWLRALEERSIALSSSLGLRGTAKYFVFVELPK